MSLIFSGETSLCPLIFPEIWLVSLTRFLYKGHLIRDSTEKIPQNKGQVNQSSTEPKQNMGQFTLSSTELKQNKGQKKSKN